MNSSQPPETHPSLRLSFFAIVTTAVLITLSFPQALGRESAHKKVIDFDDEVVEGLNKRPLDSLNQISDQQSRKQRPHLYRKRASFKYEIKETLKNLALTP
jgi:hypothetical protein